MEAYHLKFLWQLLNVVNALGENSSVICQNIVSNYVEEHQWKQQ